MGWEAEVRVGVVVLDWDGGGTTLEALGSVVATAPEACLILVDNASRRPVIEEARARFPELLAIRNEQNLGYAGGNNVGVEAAREAGCTQVLVLNNDAILEEGALAAMVEIAAREPDVAIVGGKVLDAGDPSRLSMAWGEMTFRQSLVGLAGQGRRDGPRWTSRRDVDWVSGCALLLSLDALEDIGLFDEEFFAYHEEVDLCARARAAGRRVVWTGAARIRHHGEASSGSHYVTRKQYFAGRNMVRFVVRHGTVVQSLKFWSFLVLSLPFQWLRRVLSGEAKGVALKIRGALDALRDRPIPRHELGLDHRAEAES